MLWYCGAIGFFVTAALSRIVEACAMGFSHSKVQTIDDTFASKASMESDSALGFFGNVDLKVLIAFTEHFPNKRTIIKTNVTCIMVFLNVTPSTSYECCETEIVGIPNSPADCLTEDSEVSGDRRDTQDLVAGYTKRAS